MSATSVASSTWRGRSTTTTSHARRPARQHGAHRGRGHRERVAAVPRQDARPCAPGTPAASRAATHRRPGRAQPRGRASAGRSVSSPPSSEVDAPTERVAVDQHGAQPGRAAVTPSAAARVDAPAPPRPPTTASTTPPGRSPSSGSAQPVDQPRPRRRAGSPRARHRAQRRLAQARRSSRSSTDQHDARDDGEARVEGPGRATSTPTTTSGAATQPAPGRGHVGRDVDLDPGGRRRAAAAHRAGPASAVTTKGTRGTRAAPAAGRARQVTKAGRWGRRSASRPDPWTRSSSTPLWTEVCSTGPHPPPAVDGTRQPPGPGTRDGPRRGGERGPSGRSGPGGMGRADTAQIAERSAGPGCTRRRQEANIRGTSSPAAPCPLCWPGGQPSAGAHRRLLRPGQDDHREVEHAGLQPVLLPRRADQPPGRAAHRLRPVRLPRRRRRPRPDGADAAVPLRAVHGLGRPAGQGHRRRDAARASSTRSSTTRPPPSSRSTTPAGRDVVIVSSSGAEVVEPIGEMLGRRPGGRHPHGRRGRPLHRRDRVLRLRPRTRPRRSRSSPSPRATTCAAATPTATRSPTCPMLEAVGHPYAVNPDRALRREAARRGWPVLVFTRPVRLRDRVPGVGMPARPALAAAALGAGAATAGLVWIAARRRGRTALAINPRLAVRRPHRRRSLADRGHVHSARTRDTRMHRMHVLQPCDDRRVTGRSRADDRASLVRVPPGKDQARGLLGDIVLPIDTTQGPRASHFAGEVRGTRTMAAPTRRPAHVRAVESGLTCLDDELVHAW